MMVGAAHEIVMQDTEQEVSTRILVDRDCLVYASKKKIIRGVVIPMGSDMN